MAPIAGSDAGLDAAQKSSLFQQAVAFHQQGQLRRAQAIYEEILKTYPAHSDALHLLGVIHAQSRDAARAVELIAKSIEVDRRNPAAYGNLGSALYAMRRFNEALSAYDRAIAISTNYTDAYFNRGNVLYELNRHEAALASYDAAIAINPNFASAHANRGNVLQALRQPNAALASYENAIAIKPDLVEAHANKGNVLRELDLFDAALASYDRALSIDARSVPAHFNRGVALGQLKQVNAALQSYDQAIAIDPDFAEAHFNRALLWLLTGDFARGWTEHEWRWKSRLASNFNERREFSAPLWRGEESLNGSTILLVCEQGFGDTLQLCRYVTLVANLGATVVFEVPPTLFRLLGTLHGVGQLIEQGGDLPHFDYYCPLLSLPLAFKTTLDSIPSPGRYLRSDPLKVSMWQERLGAKSRPRIGLMWNGNPIQPNDRNRSTCLADWLPHLPTGFQYVSLQRELRAADAELLDSHEGMVNTAEHLRDFSDTAALCECMDLVISVCTSVAHLSGALGKRTWILLAYAADWRWLLDRTDSPWYPSATLYRQPSRGDWASVFQRVAHDLYQSYPPRSEDPP